MAYEDWSREKLIERLTSLERPKIPPPTPKPKQSKNFNFSSFPRRKIALKFCYSGWEYGGLAYQNKPGPLPTVEGVLFDALSKARLVDSEAGFEGCGWEKCGRTDRGVSAGGQVVSFWIRSALKDEDVIQTIELPKAAIPQRSSEESVEGLQSLALLEDNVGNELLSLTHGEVRQVISLSSLASGSKFQVADVTGPPNAEKSAANKKNQLEHDYLTILNRILPSTIRIIAWSPVSESFSARFSCLHRHYKYFFSPRGLDISRMQDAASRLVGEHDFRNLCKLDPAKQITVFRRRVVRADLEPVEGFESGDALYVLNLVGSAFLYHQVRHIMSVLFMVGTGLEHPGVVSSLLNAEPGLEVGPPGDPDLDVVDCKPEYQMADSLPLMLWECGYDEKELSWRTSRRIDNNTGITVGGSLYHELQSIHNRAQIYTALNQHFLAAASKHHPPPSAIFPIPAGQHGTLPSNLSHVSLDVPLGGGTFKRHVKYKPLLKRNRIDSVEVANERWRTGKGFRREERKKLAEGIDTEEDE